MNAFMNWVETKMMPPMARIAEQRHLRAIRDGIIATLPLIIVGSFFLIIANPPVESWAKAIAPYKPKIVIPYYLSLGMMALYASFAMGRNLAKSYGLDGIIGGLLTTATFIMAFIPVNLDDKLPKGEGLGMLLPINYMGGKGLFIAILAMILAVETLRLMKRIGATIKMPESVPASVSRSFEALVPAAVIVLIMWIIRVWLEIDIPEVLKMIFKPLGIFAGNTFLGALIPVLFIMLLWSTGIHGDAVVGTFFHPIWLTLLDENAAALAAGKEMPNMIVEPFFQWFVFIGGSGTTISLVFFLLFSKSQYLKQVGRLSIIPGIFNINEPVSFGVPMVMNPIMFIPFILTPIACTITTYIAYSLDLVNRIALLPPWTLPAPIGAFLATGGDWRAIVLLLINIVLAGLIYYPFFKAYEKKMVEEESKGDAASE
ncbi:PTS sugar transporter subunit IIC [Thermoflavimicrobium dichotomicum]|uniref:Permease IIC component n=1 Tax=Thermoflavimicrobium dichotomicum TaxID=46223 RepID=A0A1I3UNM5_9BACL|nr:PTS sugar transporter subunit IIC [Thermoflavimicrobium dichotomicum]SFJ84333.1 PTS system, cellobiose-specific IIC component [Thermoflavimicrobium dichotomicum]